MWWIILVIFVAITVVIVVCVLYKRHTKKLLNDAINKSPRLAIIKGINQRYFFKTFKDKFEYVVHFTDLDEFKTSDIKLIKYSFLVKNRSKIRESLLALNNNIELFKKYTAEINNAKLLDDSSFLTNAKVNQDTYHEMEANHISSLVLKPMLKCSFLIYYDYSSPTGRSTRESEHFELRVSEIVDIDSFLINTFPEVNIIDYHFKPHYLNPHLYVHNNLLVTEEAENYLKEVDKKESETKQECLDFYSGKDVYYNWVLPSAVEKYKKTKPELLHYLDNLGLHYRLVESNKYEFFIVIENSVYLYVGHLSNNVPISIAKSQITDAYTVVIELNYNPFFDYKTSTTNEANFIYYKYLTFSEYSPLETGLKRFEALLPDINIRKINDDWEGLPCVCIVYEIGLLDKYAYSLMIVENVDNCVSVGNRGYSSLLEYEINKKIKDKNNSIYGGGYEDLMTYGLSCDDNFVPILNQVKKLVRGKIKKEDIFEDKVFEYITYYVLPINIKNKERSNIKKLKLDLFEKITHDYLSSFDSYKHVNGHQKWKNEFLLYQLCKKIYGAQVIYQYRPSFLRTEKGQLSYDIYLSKLHIAIEYQGKQHFEPVDFFGGKEAFDDLRRRDLMKKTLSKENGVKLVEITYKETITSGLVKKKVEELC